MAVEEGFPPGGIAPAVEGVAEEGFPPGGIAPAVEEENTAGNSLEEHREVVRTEERIVAESHQGHTHSSGQEGLGK